MNISKYNGENQFAITNDFNDKIIIATGDSITENNSHNNGKSWCMYLQSLIGATVYNDAVTSTGIARGDGGGAPCALRRIETQWATTYANITPDIVLFMGNMNDGTGNGNINDLGISGWTGTGPLQVGTPSDTIQTQSVYGCSKRMLEDIITMYPKAKIGWILSTPRIQTVSAWGTDKQNSYGHGWFEDYITAIKYQCEQYNVPILDLYHLSQFRAMNTENMNEYMNDGTIHPNTKGIKKYMVSPIVKWLDEYFGEV